MKTVMKRLVCSLLLVLVLIASVPASLVSALEFNLDEIDWGALGDMFGLTEDQIADLKDTVENLDEEELDRIIEDATNETEESYTVAVIGNSTRYYASLSDAIENASASEVIFVMDAAGLDTEVSESCRIIFDKSVAVSALDVAEGYAIVKGSYVFGETTYPLYMVSSLTDALYSAVDGLNDSNDAYTVALANDGDDYTMTVTLSAADASALLNGVNATVSDIASSLMTVFPLVNNICVEGYELYDGDYFYMTAADALISDLLTKQNPEGVYQMAYSEGNTLYSFPITMAYAENAYEANVNVVVKVDATESQMASIKSAMKKTYARLYIEDEGNGEYTVNANAIGFLAALAKQAGLDKAYDLATEDGLRACLDDLQVSWLCDKILAYNGSAYADVAATLQTLVNKFVSTNEYATAKDKTLGDVYVGNGKYAFTVDGRYDYSNLLKKVADTSAAYGYDYNKLVDMCKGDTTVFRTVNFSITAYATTLTESASNVVDGVLDAMDAVSEDTAYSIERVYDENGILSGINFVLTPGSAIDILEVVNRNNVIGVLESLVPVALVFDAASVNGNVLYDIDGAVSIRSALVNIYNANPLTFSTVANMEGNTLLSYDLELRYDDVVLNIPVTLSIAASDANLAKLKNTASTLAEIVEVNASLVSENNVHSADIDVTVDVSDYLDTVLELVVPDFAANSYDYIRTELNAMTVEQVLDSITLARLQTVAEKLGYLDQFNAFVDVLADNYNLDTSDPCNYEDLIAVLDSNKYFQIYLKARLQSLCDAYDVASILQTAVGAYYNNDGTYDASVGEGIGAIAIDSYIDRVVNRLLATNASEKLDSALNAFGMSSVEAIADRIKNRFSNVYNAAFDVDAHVTLIVFKTYEVTFVDEDGNVIGTQTVVAGDMATDPYYHGGNVLGVNYDADVDYDNVLSDLVVTLTPIHELESDGVVYYHDCLENGYTIWTCVYCDYVEIRSADGTALGHTDCEVIVIQKETCTEEGIYALRCLRCGLDIETIVKPALGHDWEEEIVKAPTCVAVGEMVRTCTRCGEKETVELAIDPDAHLLLKGVVTLEPTCETEGTIVYTCILCGGTVDETLSALGHAYDYTNGVYVAPTCVKDGSWTFTCVRDDCDNELVINVPAHGTHAWGDWVVTKTPNCEEDGEMTATCANCEETKTIVIAATGEHNYVTVTVNGVDCHNPTVTKTECSICGDVKEENTTPVYYPPLNNTAKDVAFLSNILVVKLEKMTVGEFKSNFYNDITVYDANGNELDDNDYVGTNCTFVCGECETSFTIAVIGDINGDGKVNALDYIFIKRHVLHTYTLEGAQLAAADVNVSLKVDAVDYIMVKSYVLRRYNFYKNVPDWEKIGDLIIKLEIPSASES